MKVALDTNILVQDFWFDSPHFRVFFEELYVVPATLFVPEIVIDETVNKYREVLSEKVQEIRKTNADLSRILKNDIKISKINITEAALEYEQFLRQKLQQVNARTLPYPKIDHKEVVSRILQRQKPFKKGDAGYRDFLIWQTVKALEVWGIEEIVFITNNSKDFGENGFLSEEFNDKKTSSKNFKISVAISRFNEEHILPRLEKLNQLKQQLADGNVETFDFKKWLDTQFVDLVNELDLEEVLTGFPYGVGKVKSNEILFYDDYQITDVAKLNSGEKLVRFKVKCKINADIDITWEDYINNEEVREYFGEFQDEFSYSFSATSGNITVEGNLILDKKNEDVKEFEVTSVTGPEGSIDMAV